MDPELLGGEGEQGFRALGVQDAQGWVCTKL